MVNSRCPAGGWAARGERWLAFGFYVSLLFRVVLAAFSLSHGHAVLVPSGGGQMALCGGVGVLLRRKFSG